MMIEEFEVAAAHVSTPAQFGGVACITNSIYNFHYQ